MTGRQASPRTEVGALPLTPQTLLLTPEAMDPGPLRERADQFLVDRWCGRSDCGGVHQASEVPAARAVTGIPACAAIPKPPRTVEHLTRPTCGSWNMSAAAQAPAWRDPLLSGRLYTIWIFSG
jgi:hypothetical protein